MNTPMSFPVGSDSTMQVRIVALHYAIRLIADFEQPRNGSHYRPSSSYNGSEVISLAQEFEKYINSTQ